MCDKSDMNTGLHERQLVIHADNARPILLKNVEPFVQKMGCGSRPIRPIHRISHRRISSCSDMSRAARKESPFNHMTDYSLEL
jgi:hypothetical protein